MAGAERNEEEVCFPGRRHVVHREALREHGRRTKLVKVALCSLARIWTKSSSRLAFWLVV
jgi:hypothetical protein